MATQTLVVHILGNDYHVSCPSDEGEALKRAAAELDQRMRDIRQTGSIIGLERIAVMAALNLSHDLLQLQQARPALEDDEVKQLNQRIDQLLP